MPPGSVAAEWEDHSSDSSLYLSPLDDSDLDYRAERYSDVDVETEDSALIQTPPLMAKARTDYLVALDEGDTNTSKTRKDLEALRDAQYWKPSTAANASTSESFDINKPESLRELL